MMCYFGVRLLKLNAFTLLEQSIIMVILAIISTSLMLYYNNITYLSKYDADQIKLQTIEKSLMAYYLNNMLDNNVDFPLPYPAKPDLDLFAENFARSSNSLDILQHQLDDYYYGIIPTRDLGLSDNYIFDSWGNRISFIRKKEIVNNTDYLKPIYFLFSHGPNGFKSYNKYGKKNNIFFTNQFKLTNLLDSYPIADDAIIIQKNYINFIADISGGKIFSKIICDYLKIYPVNDDYCKILKQKLLNLCIL